LFPRIDEIPFTSESKRMTTFHQTPSSVVAYSKGAPEVVLLSCALAATDRAAILETARQMAGDALRVLAVAMKPDAARETAECEMTFLGLVGMIDPPRPEAAAAVQKCKEAGIKVVMITGDHPLTAQAVARELGILTTGRVLTGAELEVLSDEAFDRQVETIEVYARVSPIHKLRVVTALQRRGHITAMTGDGVNDAPTLKKADIGIAMGITGTDVTKEAAVMTLTDDNFASIVAAVEEGRGIFGNIKKYLMYLLSSNMGEIGLMAGATLLGMPLPLSAVQILYVNLATDGLPALALAVEPAERGAMRRPPLSRGAHILGGGTGRRILWGGALTGIVAIGAGWAYWRAGLAQWQTALFCTVTFAQMGNVLAIRTGREPLSPSRTPRNAALFGAVAATVALQLLAAYWPALQGIFRTAPLAPRELAVCAALGALTFCCLDLAKRVGRAAGAGGCDTLSGS
jgi:Ca2+-transporting ATPase